MTTAARQERLLEEVLRQPGNDVCADCKAPAPRWASVNLGIFLCVQCASVHRKMGTHTSRVKSVTMDLWKREDVEAMRAMGNRKANALANPDEARNPPPTSTSDFADRDSALEKYIRRKWELGTFRAGGGAASRSGSGSGIGRPASSASASASSRLDPQGYSRTKTSPLPDLPPPSPDPAEGARPTYAARRDPGAKTVARHHVQSNWDDFSSFVEDPSDPGRAGREKGKEREPEGPFLSYKSTTPRSRTPAAPPAAAAAVSTSRPAPVQAPPQQSAPPPQPTLVDTSVPAGQQGPPPVIATPSSWPQPPGWPGQSPVSNGMTMPSGPFGQAAFMQQQQPQLSPGNPFLQYQATGVASSSLYAGQSQAYGMQQPAMFQPQAQMQTFPGQSMPFQQPQGIPYQAGSPYQQYPANGFPQQGMQNGGQQQAFGHGPYSQQHGQQQQMMPQGWGMR